MAFCRKPALSTRLVWSWLNNYATGSRIPPTAAAAAAAVGAAGEAAGGAGASEAAAGAQCRWRESRISARLLTTKGHKHK